jgi:hypothetical protein
MNERKWSDRHDNQPLVPDVKLPEADSAAVRIVVRYQSIDRFSKTRTFKTLAGAQKFAQNWVGKTPDLGSSYAVSEDGIGKITVSGASLLDLFPAIGAP